ncbi:MAG TPA: sugar porter family MFS transporter [Terriglobales bacterium]|nr:sugar porter family MFS transporter [Terriglobales bacterium]
MIGVAKQEMTVTTRAESFDTTYIFAISAVAALGGLLFGYDWVVIGGAKPFYEKFFHLTDPAQQGWAMSCALVGCLVGALVSGWLSDRFGRKRLLIVAGLVFAVSSIGTGTAPSFAAFVPWRMLGGFAIGMASSLSPMYIAEVAPAQYRGKLVSLNQLTIVVGILLAQVTNWLIAKPVPTNATSLQILQSWNGQVGWRWMFAVTAIPSLLFFISMFLLPESPRWLAKNGAYERAKRVLSRIGGESYGTQALHEIEATIVNDARRLDIRVLFERRMLKVLSLGIVLAVLQQWCGINVIFNYAEEVFSAAGYNVSDILFNIVVTGTVNLVFTFVAIGFVDRYGRRVLMLIGSAGLAIIYTCLGSFYYVHSRGVHMLVFVVAAIGCYAMSLAPVTWVVISEIFPNRIRGAAISVAVTALWIASFILTYTFPLFNHSLGAAKTFWIYAAICVAGFLFIKARLPETKGKTLEQIEAAWN